MKKLLSFAAAGLIALAVMAGVATAGSGYTLFGDATLVHPGNASATAVQLNSNTHSGAGYGGIDYSVPAGMTFSQIVNLATDYNFTHNSCAGGAPRFQINVAGVSAFVYVGPPPNYSGCPMNVWTNSGNLATPTSFVDTSQLPGGTFYDTFASADIKYGSDAVTGIQLVTDAGWAFPDGIQTVLIDNTQINSTTYTYEPPTPASKDDCKNGGWKNVFRSDGSAFKNQGDCIQYVNTGK